MSINPFQMMDRAILMMKAALEEIDKKNATFDAALQDPARMRRDFADDGAAIAELRALSQAGKRFLCHHIRNTLHPASLYIEADQPKKAMECIWQLEDILEQICEEERYGHGTDNKADGDADVPAEPAG